MTLDQLQAFVAVLDHGSFLAASAATSVSRSTLRARVEKLEESVGGPLFARTPDGIYATEAATRLESGARALVRDAELLQARATEPEGPLSGTVHVVLPMGATPQLLQTLGQMFRARYPGATLRLDFSPDPLAELGGDADLFVHIGDSPPEGAFRTFVLVRTPFLLLGSPAYLERRGRPETVEDLAEHDLLFWQPPGAHAPPALPLWDGGELPISPWFISSDFNVLRLMVSDGQGLAMLPYNDRLNAVVQDDVEPLLTELVGWESTTRVLLPEHRSRMRRTRAAAQFFRDLEASAHAG
ncbi:MAG: LysR family transcriptional regulator [Alphaproteobacteria bacterium]|nr:LysR family transcriptional regulator [Alphaproteobacteria bacterium]